MKKTTPLGFAIGVLLLTLPDTSSCQSSASKPNQTGSTATTKQYGCTESDIAHITALRATGPIHVDGLLDESDWQKAEKSPRFVDMASGEPAIYGTYAAVLWDDQNL